MARPKFKPKSTAKRTPPDRGALADRIASCITSIREVGEPIDKQEAMVTEAKLLASIANLSEGLGSVADLQVMAREFGICIVMCHRDFFGSGEYMPVATAARDALHAVGERFIKTGKWGVSGSDLQALRAGVELRAELLNHEDNTKGIEARAHVRLAEEIKKGNVIRFTKVEEEGEVTV